MGRLENAGMLGSNKLDATDVAAARVLSNHDGLGIAELGTACLVLWRSPVVTERFERQRAALEAMVRRYPARAGFVCVVEANVPVPEDKFRKASIQLVSKLGAKLSCVVCVIEGSGFRAAATRSVLSGMALLLPNRGTNVRFAATASDAGPVLEQHCDGVSSASFTQLHQQLSQSLSIGELA